MVVDSAVEPGRGPAMALCNNFSAKGEDTSDKGLSLMVVLLLGLTHGSAIFLPYIKRNFQKKWSTLFIDSVPHTTIVIEYHSHGTFLSRLKNHEHFTTNTNKA